MHPNSRRCSPSPPSKLSMARPDQDRSVALPWVDRPEGLDGSLIGDVGFDPFGYTKFEQQSFLVGGKSIPNLAWYREAEIAHGRVSMLAVIGYFFPSFAHFPGNEQLGADVFANTNPLDAVKDIPLAGWIQVLLAIGLVEKFHIDKLLEGSAGTGDLGLGQKSNWNPFGFNYTPEQYEEKQLQELKHCRLAMLGATGLVLQNAFSKVGITDQLGVGFSIPDYVAKAGNGLDKYFVPGI
mmetsp:Transcript_45346/g.142175  ORF Transcript_45346/g.142175 Transcript_45346/m.142175 type:complete len:238 (+) Transcript_45346:344-1057(+)